MMAWAYAPKHFFFFLFPDILTFELTNNNFSISNKIMAAENQLFWRIKF